MELPRLRTQLLIATLLIIGLLTGALLFIVRYTVRSEIARQVQEGTDASLHAFESVQREHEIDLSRTAAILAELPTLKALMTTRDALTVQDASDSFWRLAGSDLFLLAGPDRKVLGLHVAVSGWTRVDAESALGKSLDQGEDSAWWYAHGQLYWVFLRPILAGSESEQRELGVLAVGYEVNSAVARQLALVSGSQIALATNGQIIASTLSSQEESQLQGWIGRDDFRPGAATQKLPLGSDQYELASVLIHEGPPTPVTCYVLMSVDQANAFTSRLNAVIFILGCSAVLLAGFLLNLVSRTITRPLDNLVSGVRALAAGDYAYSVTPRGSIEVAELGQAFSKMRDDLRLSQEKMLASERVAALGRAANSISHDLRHYLAAVVANAEFLYEADKLRMNKDEIYEEIQTASKQMIDLLDSLRELAREGAVISPIPASIEQTIRRAADAVVAIPDLRRRTVSVSTSGEIDGVFDPTKIERAFFNLLLNACQAAPQGAGKVRVEIASSADSFDIRVIDNGSGIPASIRGTLFDPFVSSGKPNGTGLGLAIVSKILHDHGGSVSVESTSESGTIFLVELPRFHSRPRATLAVS
ncbi:MAG TPA: HAMP domain-containing sensor histidine kinase [Candidatus Acidoferrales bacterium]|jgi:signal transduction histidine kinase/type II secretory pathway pseudopilin PulG|nr:HAMP domain-containing sensor histidine kinase [Candidatus Acidoferrales bacterium]